MLPFSAVMVFKYGYGVAGLWSGAIVASVFLVIAFTAKFFFFTNWKEVIHEAEKRQELEKQEYLKDFADYLDEKKADGPSE
jgi:uncharacterized membrane protein